MTPVRKTARGDSQISHVHVIGAGTMGGDIAAVAALNGFSVSLSDREASAVEKAVLRATSLFERRLKTDKAIADANSRPYSGCCGRTYWKCRYHHRSSS
jgi:3-hydroxyacyl-CoA dehydrogenase/enoyl-CoA hydratase/3-hydroxybutyryl-CoA epimerase